MGKCCLKQRDVCRDAVWDNCSGVKVAELFCGRGLELPIQVDVASRGLGLKLYLHSEGVAFIRL